MSSRLFVVAVGAVVALGAITLTRAAAAPVVVPPEPTDKIAPAAGQDSAQIVLAGGCFWCTELGMEAVVGVTDVVSGYAGGEAMAAKYDLVAAGRTDHAEVIRVTYDPSQITLGEVFRAFFLIHDPTQLNRQGPDVGKQYRSAIFYADDAQKQAAEAYLTQLRESGLYGDPVVTTLEPLTQFHDAEDYHQDFVAKNPTNGYVVRYALPKVEKLKKHLPELAASE
ncbi:MAG: peptide-methionine (S)-S-oxide reductase MsrA [Planctomycetota bacterium]